MLSYRVDRLLQVADRAPEILLARLALIGFSPADLDEIFANQIYVVGRAGAR